MKVILYKVKNKEKEKYQINFIKLFMMVNFIKINIMVVENLKSNKEKFIQVNFKMVCFMGSEE